MLLRELIEESIVPTRVALLRELIVPRNIVWGEEGQD